MTNSVVRAPRPTDVQSHTMTVHDIIHNSLIDHTVEHLPQIALTIVIAIVVSTILRRLIGRATNRAIKKNPTETRRDARLKTLASVGKSAVSTDPLTIRVKATTNPGAQWEVQRGLMGAIMPALEAAELKTPYPHGIGITGVD